MTSIILKLIREMMWFRFPNILRRNSFHHPINTFTAKKRADENYKILSFSNIRRRCLDDNLVTKPYIRI